MPVPAALMAAGTAIQVYGQYQVNMMQAQAEIANAQFYAVQAEYARAAQFRQAAIAGDEYAARKGAQVSGYAKGNVDISGSAASVVASTLAQGVEEQVAIRQKGELDYKLAILRSRQSIQQAETLGSLQYNLLQGGGTVLRSAAMAKAG